MIFYHKHSKYESYHNVSLFDLLWKLYHRRSVRNTMPMVPIFRVQYLL